MIKVTKEMLRSLSAEAAAAPRLRKNHNFHKEDSDTLQRLLNAMEPGTYVTPHRHMDPDKREAFIVLTGKIVAVEFDDKGNITDHAIMSVSEGVRCVEIPEKTWHTLISLEKGTVLYELKDGPYDSSKDKKPAPWAPVEGDPKAGSYNASILKQLGIG